MSTRLERRSKRRFDKQRVPQPTVISDMCAMREAGLALLAAKKAYAWAVSPPGTPYGAVEPTKGEK